MYNYIIVKCIFKIFLLEVYISCNIVMLIIEKCVFWLVFGKYMVKK